MNTLKISKNLIKSVSSSVVGYQTELNQLCGRRGEAFVLLRSVHEKMRELLKAFQLFLDCRQFRNYQHVTMWWIDIAEFPSAI